MRQTDKGKRKGRADNESPPAAIPRTRPAQKTPDEVPDEVPDKFGREGTNKTIAQPKPDGAPSGELGHTPHIGKSPYTRG
jgi:hypothetical protein